MKKTVRKMYALAFVGSLFLAGNASALTLDYFTDNTGDSIYNDNGAEYAYLTDPTDPASAPALQVMSTILSTYQHDYIVGFYELDTNTGNSVLSDLNVIDTRLGVLSSNVIFDVNAGTVSSIYGASHTVLDSATMGTTFGFFIQFYDGLTGGLTSEIYYSDDALSGTDHFSTYYDPAGIYSLNNDEFGLGIGGPGTLGHALISIDDIAPVPEPATMLLFGTGLAGLAGLRRKKGQKKA